MRDIGAFIAQVGFPVFVAVWLLLREDRCYKFLLEHHQENVDLITKALEDRKHR